MDRTRACHATPRFRLHVLGALGVAALLLSSATWLPAQALDGGGRAQSLYTPPPCIGVFTDVPCGGPTPNTFANWIEQLAQDNITLGCATGMYCPEQPVLRQEMAAFLERTMRGTATWPPHTVLVFHHPAAETNSDINSGTELLSLVAAIPTTGSDAPSATNPWLVKVGPGTFDLGAGSLTLPPFTTLEGAGEAATRITASGYGNLTHGTVIMGHQSRMNRLSVSNTGGNTYETAVLIPAGAQSVVIDHASLVATHASHASGETYGVLAEDGTQFSLDHCLVWAAGAYSNWGVHAGNTTWMTSLQDVYVVVHDGSWYCYGFWSNGASPRITNSRFEVQVATSGAGIHVEGGGSLELRNSFVWLSGGSIASSAVYTDHVDAILVGDYLYSAGTGLYAWGEGHSADISNCNITAGYRYADTQSGATVTVGASKLSGAHGSAVKCFANYTASAFFADTCP